MIYGVRVCNFVNWRKVTANQIRLKLPQHQMYERKIKMVINFKIVL